MDGKGDVDAVGGLTEGIDELVVLGLGLCCCVASVRGDYYYFGIIVIVAPP